jgi:hypothetical protein
MTKDKALQMAINALTNCSNFEKTINACKEALGQPAQEPVAYMYADEKTAHVLWKGDKPPAETIALYTHPHQWQGLTDEEIEKLAHEHNLLDDYPHKFVRAIEQALKEKNT